ncbi:MAG TPA: hypothetical protein VJ438_01265 [Candidatus Nanoarchaeia archaeon]|nr:hypothetical protein [Candidatus Nanoarchaeia archaeon]
MTIQKNKQQGVEYLVENIPLLFKELGFGDFEKDEVDKETKGMHTYTGYKEVRNPLFIASEGSRIPELELVICRIICDGEDYKAKREIAHKIIDSSISTEEYKRALDNLYETSQYGMLFRTSLIIPPFREPSGILQPKEIIESGCDEDNIFFYKYVYPHIISHGRGGLTLYFSPFLSTEADNIVIRNEQEAKGYIMLIKDSVDLVVKGIKQMKS